MSQGFNPSLEILLHCLDGVCGVATVGFNPSLEIPLYVDDYLADIAGRGFNPSLEIPRSPPRGGGCPPVSILLLRFSRTSIMDVPLRPFWPFQSFS
jgi:hypothetical protein